MARKRDYKAEYAARQARARAKGFTGYYGQRVRGGAVARPSAPAPRGERLAVARGHRSAADLRQSIRPGSLVLVDDTRRNKQGKLVAVDLLVIGPDGRERIFTLRGRQISVAALSALAASVDQADAILSPSPSLDLRQVAA